MKINSIKNYSRNFNGKIKVYNCVSSQTDEIATKEITEIRRYQDGNRAVIRKKPGSLAAITDIDTYNNIILAYTAAKDGSEPKNVIIEA